MPSLSQLVIIVAAIAAFASVMALGVQVSSRDQLANRLKAVARRRQELSARQRASLKGVRFQPNRRVSWMKSVLGRLNLQQAIDDPAIKMRLGQAGWRRPSAAVTYIFARVAGPVAGFALALLYTASAFAQAPFLTKAMILLAGTAAGHYLPAILVANAVQKRQQALARGFPDALDLMVICVEAGLSVEAALLKVTDEMANSAPELAEEIGLTAAELAFLGDRRQAWDNLAERTGLAQVKSLCTALVQSEKYGTPVAQALRVLSQENRETRMAAAEKKAASLPAKLTVPMIVFFLPVLFVVIAGPAAIQVMAAWK